MDSRLHQYYYVPAGKNAEQDDASYYKLDFVSYPKLASDGRILNGLQARLFWAIWNSAAKTEFALYPLDTDLCTNPAMGGALVRLSTLENLVPGLDKSSSKIIRITSMTQYSGMPKFTANLAERTAALYFHYTLPEAQIKGFLRPFIEDVKRRDAIASDLCAKIALRPHC
ncbi:MAG TPA: hypothetical protein HA362_07715 [Nanoarchaeota archaeon]|nr:hypothetical protein [Nanoarchaeota archaeon]